MRRQLATMVARERRTRRPLLIAGVAGAVAIGTSAGAYAYVASSAPVTDKSQARCYTVASLTGGDYTTIAALSPAGTGKSTQIDDALSVCAAFWRQGILRPGAREPFPPNQADPYPVPQLVACVMPDGTAAIFPGKPGTCTALSLPAAAHSGP
jgi:hypothetical protein